METQLEESMRKRSLLLIFFLSLGVGLTGLLRHFTQNIFYNINTLSTFFSISSRNNAKCANWRWNNKNVWIHLTKKSPRYTTKLCVMYSLSLIMYQVPCTIYSITIYWSVLYQNYIKLNQIFHQINIFKSNSIDSTEISCNTQPYWNCWT